MSETKGHVLALGSINADFQMRVGRRPEISETLLGSDFVRLGGGKSANVAFLACKLGLPVLLLAHTGDDDLAEQALAPLREIGVDLSGVKTLPGHDTGVAVIMVPPDGKKGIVMAANANEAWVEEDLLRVLQAVRDAPAGSVLVCNCEIPSPVLEAGLQEARQAGLRTVLDPSPADRVSDGLLALCDYVTPNPGEAETLTGIAPGDAASALRVGQRLCERGAGAACVKLADGGCVFVGGAGAAQVQAAPVEVVDTTGAGDAFAGALAAWLALGHPEHEAVRAAVAASHIAVGKYGSQPSYPSIQEIERMQQRLRLTRDVDRQA